VAVSGTGHGETPQSLVTPVFAGLSPIAESGIKAALTTGMTTDRKIFDFPPCRGIMAEIEYPGIAKLVSRLVWERVAPPSSWKMLCPQSLDTPAIQALPPQVEVVKKSP
jgi:hypothetical protein